jgi:hypothetical protein
MTPSRQSQIEAAAYSACTQADHNGEPYPCQITFDGFKAGAKFADDTPSERVLMLVAALETYAMTNETFPEYGDVARQALESWSAK